MVLVCHKTLSESIKYYTIIIFSPLTNIKFGGLMVRIPAFHTEIRGSIPRPVTFYFFISTFSEKKTMFEVLSSLSLKSIKYRTFIK